MTDSKRSRYKEKLAGAPLKPQANTSCKVCLCRHCVCGVSTDDHFIPSERQIEEWYE